MSSKAEDSTIIDLPEKNRDTNQNPIDSNLKIDFNDSLNEKKPSINRGDYGKEGKAPFKKRLFAKIRRNAHVFPLLLSFWAPTLIFVTYYAAVSAKQLEPILPFISDAGTLPPQAGYFSMMMDIGACLFLITGYYRYRMVQYYNKQQIAVHQGAHTILHYDKVNFVSMILIILTAFGAICAGNFRMSELIDLHFIGAAFAFSSIPVCVCYQTYISFWLAENKLESKPISLFIVAMVAVLTSASLMSFSLISVFQAGWNNFRDNEWRLGWTNEKSGFFTHVCGTGLEFLFALNLSPMSLCLFNRFRKFNFDRI